MKCIRQVKKKKKKSKFDFESFKWKCFPIDVFTWSLIARQTYPYLLWFLLLLPRNHKLNAEEKKIGFAMTRIHYFVIEWMKILMFIFESNQVHDIYSQWNGIFIFTAHREQFSQVSSINDEQYFQTAKSIDSTCNGEFLLCSLSEKVNSRFLFYFVFSHLTDCCNAILVDSMRNDIYNLSMSSKLKDLLWLSWR